MTETPRTTVAGLAITGTVTLADAFGRRSNYYTLPNLALVATTATVDDTAKIGAMVIIEDGAVVHQFAILEAGASVGERAIIGSESVLGFRVTVHEGATVPPRIRVPTGSVVEPETPSSPEPIPGTAPPVETTMALPQYDSWHPLITRPRRSRSTNRIA